MTAPKIISECWHGMRKDPIEKLILAWMSEDEVRRYIRADHLLFQTIDGLEAAISRTVKAGVCIDCLQPQIY